MTQLSFDDMRPGITGEKITKDTEEWIQRNYRVYKEMLSLAMRAYYEDRLTSISQLAEYARYSLKMDGYTDGFRLNNNIRAGLSRRMIKDRPCLAKILKTRQSKVDWA